MSGWSLAAMAGAAVLVGAALPTDSTAADSNGGTTTYRWVDAQGVVHYSDTPQPGAETLQIQPAQTFSATGHRPWDPDGSPGRPTRRPSINCCVISQPSTRAVLLLARVGGGQRAAVARRCATAISSA